MRRRHRKPTARELAIQRTMASRAWRVLKGWTVSARRIDNGRREYRSAVNRGSALAIGNRLVDSEEYESVWIYERR